jgi:hypothetical protein
MMTLSGLITRQFWMLLARLGRPHPVPVDQERKRCGAMAQSKRFAMRDAVLRDGDLSFAARVVYWLLDDLAWDRGVCWPSNKYISEKLKMSLAHVKNCVRELDGKYIETERRRRKTAVRTMLWLEGHSSGSQEVKKATLVKLEGHPGGFHYLSLMNQYNEPVAFPTQEDPPIGTIRKYNGRELEWRTNGWYQKQKS